MDESHTNHDKNLSDQQNSEESPPSDATANTSGNEAAGTSSGDNQKTPVVIKFTSSLRNRNYRSNVIQVEEDSSEEQDEPMPDAEEDNDDDWEDYEEDDREEESSDEEELESSDVDLAQDDWNVDDHPLFKKETPKHWWRAINELDRRQIGYGARVPSREIFQRRCYGSLHCVKRLELMYKMEEHSGCVNCLNFHPNGSLLASGADDLKVVIWDWKLGKSLLKYKTKHRSNVFQSKFLHLTGDLHIASCARDGQVRLAQLGKEEGVRNARLLGAHKGPCHKLITLPDRPHNILSAGEDGTVLNHDVRCPKSTKVVTVKEDSKTIALYSIHGHPIKTNEFCVSGRDSFVRIYDQRKNKQPIATFTPFSSQNKPKDKNFLKNSHVTCAVYNYNGSEILASYSEADIYLFDTKETEPGKFIHKYEGHRNRATIKGVNFFGPRSEFIVSGSDCGNIFFWERNTEALVQWFPGDDSGVVNCLEPHPQLPFICTSGLDWDVKVWVPSCEEDPKMEGLKECLKINKLKQTSADSSDISGNQMLWMLWRHLRNTRRFRASINGQVIRDILSFSDSNSSASNAESNSDESDEDFDRPPNCNTS